MDGNTGRTPEQSAGDAQVGLCLQCRQRRIVVSRAGSRFYLCERARTDPAYPKYPRLPVLQCAGYERNEASAQS